MKWLDEDSFCINDSTFRCSESWEIMHKKDVQGRFVIAKSREMLTILGDHLSTYKGGNVMELGVFRGGSTVWLHELISPKKLVAVDISEKGVPDLDEYIRRKALQERIVFCGGVDQGDASVLSSIYCEHFGDAQLDVVIDDASHLLDETRASFNFLFPRVRPGGLYIIEDWNAEVGFLRFLKADAPLPAPFRSRRPMNILLMEIMGSLVPDEIAAIRSVYFDAHSAYIVRGDKPLDHQSFSVGSRLIVSAGFDGSRGYTDDVAESG